MAVSDPDHQGACQREAERVLSTIDGPLMVGVYVPQCDEHGNYQATQFHPSTGYSWCVDGHGRQVNRTITPPGRPAPDCSQYKCCYLLTNLFIHFKA